MKLDHSTIVSCQQLQTYHYLQNQTLCFNPQTVFQEPLQKDEIKKSPEQTSNNKTFEVIDTKPSPHTNNDPSDPPTNNADTTTVSFLLLYLFANSFKKKYLQYNLINILWCRKHWRIMKSRKKQIKLQTKTHFKFLIQNH